MNNPHIIDGLGSLNSELDNSWHFFIVKSVLVCVWDHYLTEAQNYFQVSNGHAFEVQLINL